MDEQVKSPLYAKLHRAMQEIENIPKDAENAHFKYKFVSSDAVASAIRATIVNVGLAFSASAVSRELVTFATSKGKQAARWVVEYRFAFHDPDSGETLSLPWFGEADADDDKGINKANTAAEKYFLMKMFIVSHENEPDPDADGPRKNASKPKAQNTRQDADDDSDDDDAPPPAWYTVKADTDRLYERLIANGYGKDVADVRGLMSNAGIDLPFLQSFATLAEAAPAIRAKLDAHLSSGKPAQPANAPDASAEPDADPLSNVPPRKTGNSWEGDAIRQAEAFTGMDSADILTKLGKPSWTTYGNASAAHDALLAAIADHQLPVVCKALTYNKFGSRGGIQTVFHAPGGKLNIPLPGGRGEIANLMGGTDSYAYGEFALENKLADWHASATRISLKVPVQVRWRINAGKPEAVELTPIFPDAEQQAA